MRDQRKSASYFQHYIEYQDQQIQKRLEKLYACEDKDKAERIQSNLLLNRVNRLVASFSYGDDAETLRDLYRKTCTTALKTPDLTYYNLLLLSSFSIMLEDHVTVKPVIDRYGSVIERDKLLYGFSTYIESGEASWQGSYQFPSVYGDLDLVISATTQTKAEDCLLSYLKIWYSKNKDCSWYGTLESRYDVYYGYWSFESAAIAKVCGLDGHRLAANEYFPALSM